MIPLSSAKEKHKAWKNVDADRFLIFENCKNALLEKKYKVLLNIEYTFCLKIIDSVVQKATKLYEKQISTGKILKFCCDFKQLEAKCKAYELKLV
ncbi:MAG: type III toxin-antitoxin system ToxN/AbiQ family toxin [Treponema sp.]|nr:type III toxin-antitoxin system ToxN/AbiQ family toxin [Treponema sp.]